MKTQFIQFYGKFTCYKTKSFTFKVLEGIIKDSADTPDMEEAEELSDRIGIMKDGRLLITDTAAGIKARAGEDSFEKAFIKIVKEGAK